MSKYLVLAGASVRYMESSGMQKSVLVLICLLLFSVAIVAYAQEPNPNFNQEPDRETPTQAKAEAQKRDSKASAGDLAKAVQNPVASLISVPVQNSSNFGIGPYDRTQNMLNLQPVVPVRASENWNLIIRWIAPFTWQPASGMANVEVFGIEENTPAYLAAQTVQKSAGVFGFGDMTPSFFLLPGQTRQADLGCGPRVRSTDSYQQGLGTGKTQYGPLACCIGPAREVVLRSPCQ
jgi:hypothetical protein